MKELDELEIMSDEEILELAKNNADDIEKVAASFKKLMLSALRAAAKSISKGKEQGE